MPAIQNIQPKYVFRGTSLVYPGSSSSQSIPVTCTTRNPLKAAFFASVCHYIGATPVVYIAETANLAAVPILQPCLIAAEEEIAFEIKPVDFYSHCNGYVTLDECKAILTAMGHPVPSGVALHNLSFHCGLVAPMDVSEIQKFITAIKSSIKKP